MNDDARVDHYVELDRLERILRNTERVYRETRAAHGPQANSTVFWARAFDAAQHKYKAHRDSFTVQEQLPQ